MQTQEKANIVSQVLKKMSLMEQADLIDAFFEYVSENEGPKTATKGG